MDYQKIKAKGRRFLPYLTALFIAAVGYLLYETLSEVDWGKVLSAMKTLNLSVASISLGAVCLVYLILSTYDFLSFRYLGIKGVAYREVLVRAFVCYAFNLNLGSLVGGLALRYRLYSNWKMPAGKIPFVILFSIFSNWLGYSFLLALIFAFQSAQIGKLIPLSPFLSKLIGGIIIGLISFYFVACFKNWKVTLKGRTWEAPSPGFALLQLTLSTFQWSLQSFIIYTLLNYLGSGAQYSQILFTFLLSSIIGVFTHVPAGLGVLELMFMKMALGVPKEQMLVALLVYRSFYYLLPLLLAVVLYPVLEVRNKKRKSKAENARDLCHQ